VYGCTVVQDQCTMVALYYCITSLPVYPNTVHGHCTTVVLDTSNRVYCIATLIVCTVQCSAVRIAGFALLQCDSRARLDGGALFSEDSCFRSHRVDFCIPDNLPVVKLRSILDYNYEQLQ